MGVNYIVVEKDKSRYNRAKERLKEIKGWYNHLLIFIIVNVILQILYGGYIEGLHLYVGDSTFGRLLAPVVWGVGLLIHRLLIFQNHYLGRFYKDWENRKIKEFIQEDTEAFNNHLQ